MQNGVSVLQVGDLGNLALAQNCDKLICAADTALRLLFLSVANYTSALVYRQKSLFH